MSNKNNWLANIRHCGIIQGVSKKSGIRVSGLFWGVRRSQIKKNLKFNFIYWDLFSAWFEEDESNKKLVFIPILENILSICLLFSIKAALYQTNISFQT